MNFTFHEGLNGAQVSAVEKLFAAEEAAAATARPTAFTAPAATPGGLSIGYTHSHEPTSTLYTQSLMEGRQWHACK